MITRNQIEINGKRISYLHSGSGPDLILLIHGSGGSAENWLPQLEDKRLSSNCMLAAIDLPGHGESFRAGDDATMYHPQKMAELVEPILRHLNPKRFLLVGLSLGTNIIAEIADPIPGCKGIMLVSSCILNDENLPADILTPGPYGHVMASTNAPDEDIRSFVYSHMTNETIANKYICDYKNTDPAFREQLGKMFMEGSWTNELANVKSWNVPICVVMGENDSLLKIKYLESFSPLWKNRLQFIKDAGHLLNQEQPEQFTELLLAYANDQFK